MSFPPRYIPSEPTDAGASPGANPEAGLGLRPVEEDVEIREPLPGDAVDTLRETRRPVAFVGLVGVTIGLLVMVPAATFAVLKWKTDPMLARKLVMVAVGGFVWLIPALYLRAYARRIKRLIGFPTDDLLTSALAAQKNFWRTASLLLAAVLLIAAGLGGKFVWSKGIRTVSADVRSRLMAFAGQALAPPATTPADPTPAVAATQPSTTQPAATQPAGPILIVTQPAAPDPAVAATPAEPTPPPPPIQSDQASVETAETPATDE